MLEYSHSLTIDTPDVLVDGVDAKYLIDATWERRNRAGYCGIREATCSLASWGQSHHSRDMAVALSDDAWVDLQERAALEAWLENAARDEADEWADWQRDMRHDMAAE